MLLDELVTIPRGDELPADFAARVLARRPFAPWEVSRASYWRLPAGIGLGLLAGSLGLALTPLWSLGPGTAAHGLGRARRRRLRAARRDARHGPPPACRGDRSCGAGRLPGRPRPPRGGGRAWRPLRSGWRSCASAGRRPPSPPAGAEPGPAMARRLLLLASVVLLAASGRAPAQPPSVVPAGEVRAGDLVVLGRGAVVEGVLAGTLVAVGGTVRVAGRVEKDVIAFGGDVVVEPGAQIRGDLLAVGGAVRTPAGPVPGRRRPRPDRRASSRRPSPPSFRPRRWRRGRRAASSSRSGSSSCSSGSSSASSSSDSSRAPSPAAAGLASGAARDDGGPRGRRRSSSALLVSAFLLLVLPGDGRTRRDGAPPGAPRRGEGLRPGGGLRGPGAAPRARGDAREPALRRPGGARPRSRPPRPPLARPGGGAARLGGRLAPRNRRGARRRGAQGCAPSRPFEGLPSP